VVVEVQVAAEGAVVFAQKAQMFARKSKLLH
jgi:hypothetical protein